MGLTQCGNYTAGIKALAGLSRPPPLARGRLLQRRRPVRLGHRAALILALLASKLRRQLAMAASSSRPLLGLLWLLPWLSIFPDKEQMTAISLKPAARRARAGAGDRPLQL